MPNARTIMGLEVSAGVSAPESLPHHSRPHEGFVHRAKSWTHVSMRSFAHLISPESFFPDKWPSCLPLAYFHGEKQIGSPSCTVNRLWLLIDQHRRIDMLQAIVCLVPLLYNVIRKFRRRRHVPETPLIIRITEPPFAFRFGCLGRSSY
jgi:hypothetical protein